MESYFGFVSFTAKAFLDIRTGFTSLLSGEVYTVEGISSERGGITWDSFPNSQTDGGRRARDGTGTVGEEWFPQAGTTSSLPDIETSPFTTKCQIANTLFLCYITCYSREEWLS
jgi:hypothetical protein